MSRACSGCWTGWTTHPPRSSPRSARRCARAPWGQHSSRAAHLAELLLADDAEFRTLWSAHEVGLRPHDVKTLVHPQVGTLRLHCQQLVDSQPSHVLLVCTARPGTEDYDTLQMLGVISTQQLLPD